MSTRRLVVRAKITAGERGRDRDTRLAEPEVRRWIGRLWISLRIRRGSDPTGFPGGARPIRRARAARLARVSCFGGIDYRCDNTRGGDHLNAGPPMHGADGAESETSDIDDEVRA